LDGVNEIFSKLEDEAYARVMWGDRAAEIEEWLIERGLPASDAREFKPPYGPAA
jgi:hypothetical protein